MESIVYHILYRSLLYNNAKAGISRYCLTMIEKHIFAGPALRLAGGGYGYGRLEMAIDGRWGTVGQRYPSLACANTVCHQLGFLTGLDTSNFAKRTDIPVALYISTHCETSNALLWQNPHSGYWSVTTHSYDRGTFCYVQQPSGK